jgi:hypothetical protein
MANGINGGSVNDIKVALEKKEPELNSLHQVLLK